MKSLMERIHYDFDQDFSRLLDTYLHCDDHDFVRGTAPHFALLERQSPALRDHGPVLAVSMGGSTTKLAIGSTAGGALVIHHMVSVRNPTQTIHFYDFLDELLYGDERVRDYLEHAERPALCFTLPVMINEENIPFHPVKIRYIEGFLARNDSEMVPEMGFDRNMARYFASRGKRAPHVYIQSDPVIAHLGALTLTERRPDERTILLVCGTGMATADNNVQRVVSRLRMMDFDEGLYPEEFTEGYVYETACSGKGLYDIMARAAAIRAREPGSALAGCDVSPYFQSLYDSALVAEIWESTLDPSLQPERVSQLRAAVGAEAFRELCLIAEQIMLRVAGSLAGTALVTAAKLDLREFRTPYYLLFEGSIALDPYINERILARIEETQGRPQLFAAQGLNPPEIRLDRRPQRQIRFDEAVEPAVRGKIDVTLAGTVIAAIADDIIHNEREKE